jgi:hypothetical protein
MFINVTSLNGQILTRPQSEKIVSVTLFLYYKTERKAEGMRFKPDLKIST